ncbi:MAG TPA: hypothetical protein VK636_19410 [Gemmatimonadaceae bacterium]|nr:hypothetical protein [Gemmatimonadaceae bacterium]
MSAHLSTDLGGMTSHLRRSLTLAVFALLSLSAVGRAQGTDTAKARPGLTRRQQGGRAVLQPQRQQPGAANRPALERAINQAVGKAVRRQLNLNDQQVKSLQRTNQRFDVQRRTLLRDERTTRQNLKAAMLDSGGPDQAKIGVYLDQLTQMQHQRADLLAGEQKELSSFLTPMQRAQYLSLRERIAARIAQFGQPDSVGQGGGRRGVPPLDP